MKLNRVSANDRFNYSSLSKNGGQKRLRQSDHYDWRVNVTNDYWTASLEVGSENQGMNVIFDTSTDWLALQGELCDNCSVNKFYSSASSTS